MQVAKPKKGYKLVKTLFGKYEEIPEEWDRDSFENHYRSVKGVKPAQMFENKGIDRLPYLTNNSLSERSQEYVQKSEGVLVNESDIIMSVDGTVGKVYTSKKGILGSTFILFNKKQNKIDNKFIFYYLRYKYPLLRDTSYGTGVLHLDKFILKKLQIPILPQDEQKQIASILSNVDDTLQKTNQIIEQTQRLKKGMMQKLLTRGIGHTKFKKVKWYFGKQIEIPVEWKLEKMSDLCVKITDGTHHTPKYVNKGKLFLSVLNVRPNRIILDHVKYISPDEHSLLIKRTKPELLDILYTKVGVTYGFAAVVENISDFSIFVSLALLKPKKELIDPYFLCELMNSYVIKCQADIRILGIAVPDLHLVEIKKFEVFVPSLPEQKQIASILSNINTQIQKEKLHKSNLERLKKGLMQKLLTGQIRVKV